MSDLTITDFETYVVANPWKPWVFVRVETDAGIHGVGEATTGATDAVLARLDSLRDTVIGMDPLHTETLYTPNGPGFRLRPNDATGAAAIAGIEMACWDVTGKHLDLPLYELLGGPVQGRLLDAYANGWYTDVYRDGERDPEKFARVAEDVVSKGYDALKFDPFGSAWKRMRRTERTRSIEIVRAVRDAVGPDVDILIEGHQRFDTASAIDVARQLEPFDPLLFEEPTPPETAALRRVADQSAVTVATGESFVSHRPFAELLDRTTVGIVQPDLIQMGGITPLRKVAALADAKHVGVAPHNARGPFASAATLHVAASIPNFRIQETFEEFAHPTWAPDLLDSPVEIDDGEIVVPSGPGIGVDLELDAVREYALTDADDVHFIDLFADRWEARSFEDR